MFYRYLPNKIVDNTNFLHLFTTNDFDCTKLPFTLSDAMGRILTDQPVHPGEGILRHPEGVDLMPADIQLSGMEVSLVNAMSRETILRQYLDTVKGQYSHILIDCQPSLGMLHFRSLMNDYHLKDLSSKVKSVLHAKKKSGQYGPSPTGDCHGG